MARVIRCYKTVDEMLQDPGLTALSSICIIAGSIAKHAIAAAKAGKQWLIIEKPLALNWQDVWDPTGGCRQAGW